MPLFELQRIWDAWPNIYNHQVLRGLFRQISTPRTEAGGGTSAGHVTDHVTVIPGHLFVSTVHSGGDALTEQSSKDQPKLYAFSRVPLKVEPKSCDDHMTPYLLQLNSKCKKIVSIIDCSVENQQRVIVFQDCGVLSAYEFDSTEFIWKLKEEIPFSSSLNARVHDVVLHVPTNKLVISEQPHSPNPHTSHSSQVTVCSFDYPLKGSISLGTSKVILSKTPSFSLRAFSDGVCFLPNTGPYPKGLIVCWCPSVSGELCALVWGCNRSPPLPIATRQTTPTLFRALTLRLAGYWSKLTDGPGLIALETNPHTGQLLALAGDGVMYLVSVSKQGLLERTQLTKLSDFCQRNPTPFDIFSNPHPYHQPRLFCVHTYYGYCLKGELRIYDSFTGEFVWECDDHEGAGSLLWTTPTSPAFCGLHGNGGMWLLRCHKIADHAQFMASALFPITTNADETTPGDYLDSGQLLAAKLSKLWKLNLLVTRYSLEGAFDAVKENVDANQQRIVKDSFLPHLHQELIDLLRDDSFLQNPALLVALLAEYPGYRAQLSDCVSGFLDRYHSNSSSNNDLLTPLNTEIVPLLEEFLQLSREFDSRLEQLEVSTDTIPEVDVRAEIYKLLKSSEAVTVSDGEVGASSRAHFHSLCDRNSEQALLGIKDFFDVTNFEKAVLELESGSWSSARNWRGILATESAVRIQRNFMRATTNHLPLFEETCRLLYHTSPMELLSFVTFAQLARDHQAQGDSAFARKCRKNFFFHRALNALPMFVSIEATPTSREAIQARCQLLLRSDYHNAHMSCLQLLLANELWADAITLVEEVKNEESSHCALFHSLLVSLSKHNMLYTHLERVWTLLPKKFSVFDFMGALKMAIKDSQEGSILVSEGSPQLTVASVGAKLMELLRQTNLNQLKR